MDNALLLLQEDREDFFIAMSELHSLEETEILDIDIVRRMLNPQHVEDFRRSDPRKWPAILVTKTDFGYVLLDGYHRVAAAVKRGFTQILAICRTFQCEADIIEAIFDANVINGLKISRESRSAFAHWLWKRYPQLTYKEIGLRCGITPSAVSHAISRRETPQLFIVDSVLHYVGDPPDSLLEGANSEYWRKKVLKLCRALVNNAQDLCKTFDEQGLDDIQRKALLIASLEILQNYQNLMDIVRLLEDAFKPKAIPENKQL